LYEEKYGNNKRHTIVPIHNKPLVKWCNKYLSGIPYDQYAQYIVELCEREDLDNFKWKKVTSPIRWSALESIERLSPIKSNNLLFLQFTKTTKIMGYPSLAACVADLEKHGHLVRIKEEVDPHLEMAAIHMRVYDAQGPALLFENIKGSEYPAVSNLFGTL